MLKKYRDVVCGGILIFLAIGLYIASFGIKSVALNLIKADFFPRLDAALLAVCGIVLVITGSVKAKTYQEPQEKGPPFWKSDGSVCMLETLALIAVYLLLLEPVGFVISTFAYLVAQMIVLMPKEKRRKKPIFLGVVIALIASLGIYLIFVKVFFLMLPNGILHI